MCAHGNSMPICAHVLCVFQTFVDIMLPTRRVQFHIMQVILYNMNQPLGKKSNTYFREAIGIMPGEKKKEFLIYALEEEGVLQLCFSSVSMDVFSIILIVLFYVLED